MDQVFVNRLEKLSLISVDAVERDQLCGEINEALQFIGELKSLESESKGNPFAMITPLDQLPEYGPEKVLFAFFENVPEREGPYVIF